MGRVVGIREVCAGLVLGALGQAGVAAAEPAPHEVQWVHAAPGPVRSFEVLISPVKGPSDQVRVVEVGKPAGTSAGAFQNFSAMVSMESDEFVAIRAVGRNGMVGALSAWGGVTPTRPGQPRVVAPAD